MENSHKEMSPRESQEELLEELEAKHEESERQETIRIWIRENFDKIDHAVDKRSHRELGDLFEECWRAAEKYGTKKLQEELHAIWMEEQEK